MPRKRKYPSLDLKPWVTTFTLNMPGKGRPGGLEALKTALLNLPQPTDPIKAAVEENDKLWERVVAITRRQKDVVILGLEKRLRESSSNYLQLCAINRKAYAEMLDLAHDAALIENLKRFLNLKVTLATDHVNRATKAAFFDAVRLWPARELKFDPPIPIDRFDFKA